MILSHKKTRAFMVALFLVGLSFLAFYQTFWPWILIVVGASLGFRSIALGHYYEGVFNILTFGGLTWTYLAKISWSIVLPIVLVIAAIYEVYKAYVEEVELTERDKLEDKQHELEEEEQEKD